MTNPIPAAVLGGVLIGAVCAVSDESGGAFAWFVWERGAHDAPRLGWLP